MFNLRDNYEVDFQSDGTGDTLKIDVSKPPLNIEGTPTDLDGVQYRTKTSVPAAPYIAESSLSGTKLTVKFSGDVPENDISQQPATYTLYFALKFEAAS